MLVYIKAAKAIDDLCSVLIIWVRKLNTNGKHALEKYRTAHSHRTDSLVGLLYKIVLTVKAEKNNGDQVESLVATITDESDSIIKKCEEHLAYAGDNHYPFMLKPYLNKRYLFFKILDQLFIQTASQDKHLVEAIDFIKWNRKTNKKYIDLDYKLSDGGQVHQLNINWLSDRWYKMVTGKTTRAEVDSIHRHYFELSVMCEVMRALNSNDIYAENGYQFDDPNKQYISWEEFNCKIEEYCSLVGLSEESTEFVRQLQCELKDTASHVDKKYPKNTSLSIENGLPVLKRSKKKAEQGRPPTETIHKTV